MSFLVKKYNIEPVKSERWLLIGNNREYFLTEYSCPCKSFQLLQSKKSSGICKHILLVREAIKTGKYDSYSISIPEYQNIRKYLLNIKK